MIQDEKLKRTQTETRCKFDKVSKEHDKKCLLRLRDMRETVYVNYCDEKLIAEESMYRYRVLNTDNKKLKLTLWVGYDLGGRNYETGELEVRGYYLYFTTLFKRNITSRKLLLFETQRKSQKSLAKAVALSSLFGKAIVSNYYDKLEIDWEHPVFEKYGALAYWLDMERIRAFRSIKNCVLEF